MDVLSAQIGDDTERIVNSPRQQPSDLYKE